MRARLVAALLLWGAALTGCAAPFADLQGARLAGKGKVEVTPSFTSVAASQSGASEAVQREYGFMLAAGTSDHLDWRFRYIRVAAPGGSGGEGSFNVLGIGPKFGITPNRVAIGLPIGFAFGDGIDNVGDTFQCHPTLFVTLPAGRCFEVNVSGKALFWIGGGLEFIGYAGNIGLGISTDLDRWAIRPEFGVQFHPGDGGYLRQASLGLSWNLGR
jgi:hypothetical protein